MKGKIFNTESVKAIMENRKTMFRVPVKESEQYTKVVPYAGSYNTFLFIKEGVVTGSGTGSELKAPYGTIGDRIYVRETWCNTCGNKVCYRENMVRCDRPPHFPNSHHPWKSSSCMPKKYARIWLEITDIRVERVQDITEEDAVKEGFKYEGWIPTYNDPDSGGDGIMVLPSENSSIKWNSKYRNWSDNPWIFIIEFKRIDK